MKPYGCKPFTSAGWGWICSRQAVSLSVIAPALVALCPLLNAAELDYAPIDAVFQKHCVDCHNGKDAEAQLLMDSHDLLMKGGESGPAIIPGKSSDSLLVQMIEGRFVRKGKTLIMPPGQKRKKLEAAEIALIRAWIDAGAKGPANVVTAREFVTPKIPLKVEPRRPISAVAASGRVIAIGRYGEVELMNADQKLAPHRGNVNALVFSSDGTHLFAAAGEAGLFGEVRQWNVPDGKLVRVFEGHQDAIYSLALSPDGKVLATGSYDQKIRLWEAASGKETQTLTGHNGAIFALAFRPDGKILASASADRTVKLWHVETGKRTDTLSQPLKEQNAVLFSRDGKRLFAAGADNRIRVWQVSETAVETTNPILESKFAHEGSVLRLALSADGKWLVTSAEDRLVKIWDAATLIERAVLEPQPDWPLAIAFAGEGQRVAVGRADGSLGVYDAASGRPITGRRAEVK